MYDQAIRQRGLIEYDSSYPKFRFLQYLSLLQQTLFHGSNNNEIDEFEPRRQTLYNGRYVDAVFATNDGIRPFFYAILNKSKLMGDFRNDCLALSKKKHRYYFFSCYL
ncbi:hypothetical protein ACFO1S_28235 [Cohnella boryungensis]|uniref:Uncharacterized protein n=1 Tax=Cohnella boryungensis TaxID=768479 RepID=A0ABV8SJX9_9BACL